MFNLGKYLREHGLSAYALVQEVKGQVPASTVYGLARKPARRIDLPVAYALLDALTRLRGERVELEAVVEHQEIERQAVERHEAGRDQTATPDLSPLQLPVGQPQQGKTFHYSGPGQRVNLPSGTVSRLIAEGREP